MNLLYSTYTYICIYLLLSGNALQHSTSIPTFHHSTTTSKALMTPTQTVDSLALVALYQSTIGAAWTNRWILSQPVSNWFGVELDGEGYVTKIQLNNNNLQGRLPVQIGNFSRLQHLQLDNNGLRDTIPASIGLLRQLTILFLDDNELSGIIPKELGNIVPLQTIFLDNNQLTGAIPQSFQQLSNLWTLDIFNNQIDSLPDLSGINLQRNRFRVFGNQLTFDDLIPNLGIALGDNYINQDSFFQTRTYNALTGQSFTIDLGIDASVVNNRYQWFKNGVPFGTPLNENKLRFTEIDWTDAGVYHCQVTNPEAPLLTLYSRAITLRISCGHSYEDLQDTLCANEQRVIRGITFNASNPRQDIYMPGQDRYGCDSTLRVNFFIEVPAQANLDTTLCPGESLLINGSTYNEANPSGTERFISGAANGCDSLLTIQINFYPEALLRIQDTLCTDGSLIVNGNTYDETNPSGTEIIPGGSVVGCDSTILVDLTFSSSITNNIQQSLCPGGFIFVNGTRYDEANPTGSEMLQTQRGCDSLINIDLTFFEIKDTLINETICENETLTIGGEIFTVNRPNGTLTLTDQNGCDSIVRVDLQFEKLKFTSISSTLCYHESLTVNGTVYDRNRPAGTEVIPSNNTSGCDSVVSINLSFRPDPYYLFEPVICEDEQFIYNGRIYDKNNPSETILLPGRAAGGCDSIVDLRLQISVPTISSINDTFCANEIVWIGNRRFTQNFSRGTVVLEDNNSACDSILEVDLHFLPMAINYLNDTLCDSEFLTINGTIYDADNPRGMEFLPSATPHGCDSTVIINLYFDQSRYGAISDHLCDDDQIVVGGEIFDVNRPKGTVIISGVAPNGCDSIILVDLSFDQSSTALISDTLCQGEILFVNGTLYDENNPSGTEIIPTGNLRGCDSTVTIALSFYPSSSNIVRESLCPGESLLINGIRYSEFRRGGIERIPGGGANGCDSLIDVLITYYDEPLFSMIDTLCIGESIEVNGTIYNEQNPIGTEIIINGSLQGCDSTVNIELSYYPTAMSNYSDTLCPGDQVIINGTVYDEQDPTGVEIIEGVSLNGCDSMVTINLSFHEKVTFDLNETLCHGESIIVNGVIYDESRPQGIEVFPAQTTTGCDSTVFIALDYYPAALYAVLDTICLGITYDWRGQQFTQSGVYYDTLNSASINGCDSVLALHLFVVDEIGTLNNPAGDDQEVCPGSAQLSATLPTGTIGFWANNEGLTFSDPTSPTTEVTGLQAGMYTLYWQINSPQCQVSVRDSLFISLAERPLAIDDVFNIAGDKPFDDFNVLLNDDTEVVPSRQVELLSQPSSGRLEHVAGGKYRYFKSTVLMDTLEFQYRICNDECTELCDTARVQLILEPIETEKDEEIFIPSGITPNDDGVNDAFVIPVLEEEPDRFPQNELVVFNRWGQIVFQQNNYQNDWKGTDGSGKSLTAGTYYYILRLSIANGMIFKGDLTIVR